MMDHDYGYQLGVAGFYPGGQCRSLPQPPPPRPGSDRSGGEGLTPSSTVSSPPSQHGHSLSAETPFKSELSEPGEEEETERETAIKDRRKIKTGTISIDCLKLKKQAVMEGEDSKDDKIPCKGAPKQSQIAATLRWLSENYERADGVCLPRCVLYTHYLDFCKKQSFSPAGAATFGKIIRQKFPKLTTRRLGTRGQSKYHYYGIGIKETSIYYHSVYTGKGLTRFSGTKVKTEGSSRKYSLSSKTGTILPEFPEASNLLLPDNVDKDKVQTFVMMYRTHCQRILDTVISANFDEVQSFLLHFWQGMPEHLIELLKLELIADTIGLCDSILYKVLVDVLIPTTIQDLPDSLSSEMKAFVRRLVAWLESSLEDVPLAIRAKKMEAVKTFALSVKRQISFVHLAQTTRNALMCSEGVTQMLEDLSHIDFNRVCEQASFTNPAIVGSLWEKVNEYFTEFKHLLKKQASIEAFTEWIDNIIDSCVLAKSKQDFSEKAAQFLMQWTILCSLILRDLTLLSASSFGSFHLIHIMLDEYVFLVMETQHNQAKDNELQKAMKKHLRHDEKICTEPKRRPAVPKSNASPKARKRKYSEDDDANEIGTGENFASKADDYSKVSDSHMEYHGSQYGRLQGCYREPGYPYPIDGGRHPYQGIGPAHHTLSPLKHFSPVHGNTFDRASYLSHLSINTYPEYMAQTATIPSPRMPSVAEVQNYPPTGPFTGNSLNMGPASPPYWNEARPHSSATFPDPYPGYPPYGKYSASYDSYNRGGALLRGGGYPHQDGISRSAFEAPRHLYGRAPERPLPGFPMSAYSGSHVEMAHHPGVPPSQCPRQEVVFPHAQDDYYHPNVANALPYSKQYVSPYR